MSRPLRVLLLEDRQDDARLILHELRRAGFEPAGERVETEADFLAHLDPALDLILADYHLPEFDALQALRLVRERGLDVPVIVVTGALGDEAAVECLKQGAADYLLKDRLARLGQAVAQALEQKQARDDQRRAEEALRESEARKTAILETALDGIITIDHQGRILEFNPAAEAIFGYTRAEAVGRPLAELIVPPAWRERHRRRPGALSGQRRGPGARPAGRDDRDARRRRRVPGRAGHHPDPRGRAAAVHRLRPRHHRAQAGGGRTQGREGGRRGRQPGQGPVPGHPEPRAPHPPDPGADDRLGDARPSPRRPRTSGRPWP